eukprot:m.61088 g.61088  ORF g.61088 m.61088 type:complete len:425 (-) comp13322_c0_seq2:21-1295(-)
MVSLFCVLSSFLSFLLLSSLPSPFPLPFPFLSSPFFSPPFSRIANMCIQRSLSSAALSIALITLLSCRYAVLTSGELVTISNVYPHVDTTGEIMDAHDGTIVQWEANGPYYFYGMSYGLCKEPNGEGCSHDGGDPNCGFRTDHNVSIFTSPNLANGSWQYVGNALPPENRPTAIYYRPKVKFNPNTNLYVLWLNGVPAGDFGSSFYLVATSSSPSGPFEVQTTNVSTFYPAGGDFDILVDDDGAGYLIYTSVVMGHNISVERLNSDFLSSTLENSGFFGETFVEAPNLFKRKGVYYALFGHCCCFCSEGSGIGVYTATSPLGPYMSRGNIGCSYPGPKGPMGCGVDNGVSITQAQQNVVFTVTSSDNSKAYVWTGDRWQSAPDGIKAHDFQYWTPLTFNDTEAQPSIMHLTHLDEFTLDVKTPQ